MEKILEILPSRGQNHSFTIFTGFLNLDNQNFKGRWIVVWQSDLNKILEIPSLIGKSPHFSVFNNFLDLGNYKS